MSWSQRVNANTTLYQGHVLFVLFVSYTQLEKQTLHIHFVHKVAGSRSID